MMSFFLSSQSSLLVVMIWNLVSRIHPRNYITTTSTTTSKKLITTKTQLIKTVLLVRWIFWFCMALSCHFIPDHNPGDDVLKFDMRLTFTETTKTTTTPSMPKIPIELPTQQQQQQQIEKEEEQGDDPKSLASISTLMSSLQCFCLKGHVCEHFVTKQNNNNNNNNDDNPLDPCAMYHPYYYHHYHEMKEQQQQQQQNQHHHQQQQQYNDNYLSWSMKFWNFWLSPLTKWDAARFLHLAVQPTLRNPPPLTTTTSTTTRSISFTTSEQAHAFLPMFSILISKLAQLLTILYRKLYASLVAVAVIPPSSTTLTFSESSPSLLSSFLLQFVLPPTFEGMVVLSGFLWNNVICLILSIHALYHLTVLLLVLVTQPKTKAIHNKSFTTTTSIIQQRQNQQQLQQHNQNQQQQQIHRIAIVTCLVYGIWNPALIFFTTNYSESLFSTCTLLGHLYMVYSLNSSSSSSNTTTTTKISTTIKTTFQSIIYFLVAIIFWMMATYTRSNGTIHSLWLLHYGLAQLCYFGYYYYHDNNNNKSNNDNNTRNQNNTQSSSNNHNNNNATPSSSSRRPILLLLQIKTIHGISFVRIVWNVLSCIVGAILVALPFRYHDWQGYQRHCSNDYHYNYHNGQHQQQQQLQQQFYPSWCQTQSYNHHHQYYKDNMDIDIDIDIDIDMDLDGNNNHFIMDLSISSYLKSLLSTTTTTTTTTSSPSTFSHFYFSLYTWTQKEHWNVGMFHYYEMKQIPNFLLAMPILVVSIVAVYAWIHGSLIQDYGKGKLVKFQTPKISQWILYIFVRWPMYALAQEVYGIMIVSSSSTSSESESSLVSTTTATTTATTAKQEKKKNGDNYNNVNANDSKSIMIMDTKMNKTISKQNNNNDNTDIINNNNYIQKDDTTFDKNNNNNNNTIHFLEDYLVHNPLLLGQYAILAFLTLIGIVIAHVQISTRMICSSSPAIIWFLTYCYCISASTTTSTASTTANKDDSNDKNHNDNHQNNRNNNHNNDKKETNLHSNRKILYPPSRNNNNNMLLLGSFLTAYTILYWILGIILHVNFLPWT